MSYSTRLQAASLRIALLGTILLGATASAESKEPAKTPPKDSGTVAGLVTEKRDGSITVLADGEEQPVKYLVGQGTDKRSLDGLKSIFDVDRVTLKYKLDGDARRVVSVEKVNGKANGVVVGEVLKVYNNFWVAVKPKGGVPEGYALNGPAEKVKAAADVLKSLKPGDIVAIKFSTDFERHRILQIEVKPTPK